ncbi:MAG: protein kinase [Polyangiaceae bacterium]|nr:protein kinase [Polyangiaceae bacterium]
MSQDPTKLERARMREGTWLGQRYRLGQLIGLDELCASYFAASTTGQVVEANILNPELADIGGFRSGFVNAARAPQHLGLEAFGTVKDTGTTDDRLPYFVGSELGEGESLGDLVRRRGRTIPPSEALRIIGNLLAALAAAHGAGFVHGLIEPNHIFMTEDGGFKIRGLGLSELRIAAVAALKLRAPWQTMPFIAPEVLRGEAPSQASDIWSSGAVLFYLLTGELPYAATGELLLAAAQTGQTLLLNEVEPRSPLAMVDLLAHALQPEPRRRIGSAALFAAKARAYSEVPEIGMLRFLGDTLAHGRGSGPVTLPLVRKPMESKVESDRPPVATGPSRGPAIPRGPSRPSRPSGGYSQISNAVTSVSLSGMQRISSPPPALNQASGTDGGTLHTQSTRPPKRG